MIPENIIGLNVYCKRITFEKKGERETLIFQKFVRAFFNQNFRERLQIHK